MFLNKENERRIPVWQTKLHKKFIEGILLKLRGCQAKLCHLRRLPFQLYRNFLFRTNGYEELRVLSVNKVALSPAVPCNNWHNIISENFAVNSDRNLHLACEESRRLARCKSEAFSFFRFSCGHQFPGIFSLYIAPEKNCQKNSMESKGGNGVSSKNESTEVESFQNQEEVDSSDKEAGNVEKREATREISCQTEFNDIFRQKLEEFEDELQLEGDELEKEFIEEKSHLESKLRNEYNEIIKAKDELIRVLTEEKDFFLGELRDLRKSFDLFTRHVHRDSLQHMSQCGYEKELGTKPRVTGNGVAEVKNGFDENTFLDCGELTIVLRKQEEVLLRSFEREKAEMTQRFEREKLAVRKLVEEECQARYAYERAYLLQSIEGLKEGLDSLRIQKDELAKIFEGEKNALELGYKRKEDELRQNLKLELQRKVIHAQKPWTKTKI